MLEILIIFIIYSIEIRSLWAYKHFPHMHKISLFIYCSSQTWKCCNSEKALTIISSFWHHVVLLKFCMKTITDSLHNLFTFTIIDKTVCRTQIIWLNISWNPCLNLKNIYLSFVFFCYLTIRICVYTLPRQKKHLTRD